MRCVKEKILLYLLKNEAGAAFIMVLAATMVLYITAATFTVMITNQTKAVRADRNKQKAFYMAEAGLNRALVKRVRYPNKKNATLNIGIPVPIEFKDENNNKVGTYQVEFAGVNKDTGVVDPTDNLSDVKKLTSTGVIEDTSGGSPVNIESVQSEYTQSPFNRDIWATGTVRFESSVEPGTFACVAEWFGAGWAETRWNVFGNLYSASQPTDDWRRFCCPFGWETRLCWFGNCGCEWYQWCCCDVCIGGWKDFGARYVTNQQLCSEYWGGGCCNNWEDGECIGYGGGTCCPNQGTALNEYYWSWEGVENPTPFPQFIPPADPRIPGSSSNLEYMTGSEVEERLRNPEADHNLSNLWVDGSVTIDKDIFDGIAKDGLGIYGIVFINGSFNYQYEKGAWLTAVCLVTDSNDPGTLIINEGDLRLWSAGSPNFGRVNIVLVNGDLTLESKCGILTKGIYYAGGHTVDPITKKREGGTITIEAAQDIIGWLSGVQIIICDTVNELVEGITGIHTRSYSEVYGATIGKDIKFEGATKCNVVTNSPFTKPCADKPYIINEAEGNEDLRIPEGFWSVVRVYNWREEK